MFGLGGILKSIGLEDRASILPTPNASPIGPGLLGPNYSFADNLPMPHEVGVKTGDSLESVVNSVRAVGYYVDMIGFGEASSDLSRVGPNGGPKALGVNTWMRTGLKCSNGADMWMYNEGIPTGGALGKTVKEAMGKAGLPALRGLAPGIMEDAQSALDPMPILKTVFGTGYPRCRLVNQMVGDQDGNIQNQNGDSYVDRDAPLTQEGNRYYQKRWAYDGDLTEQQWNADPKTHCADGFLIKNHDGNTCEGKLISTQEGFRQQRFYNDIAILTAVLLGGIVLSFR